MQVVTQLYQIDGCQSVLREEFVNNKNKWELTDTQTETSIIKDGYYWLNNKSSSRWNYYKLNAPIKLDQDFMLDASIELLGKNQFGHFGLVWGFDKEISVLNRFTLSADGKRAVIMQFDRNHQPVYHRFQTRTFPKVEPNKPIRFTVIKLGEYFHFLLNTHNIYMVHQSQLIQAGHYVGYYIEPNISIRSKYIEIKKIKSNELTAATGLTQLL